MSPLPTTHGSLASRDHLQQENPQFSPESGAGPSRPQPFGIGGTAGRMPVPRRALLLVIFLLWCECGDGEQMIGG